MGNADDVLLMRSTDGCFELYQMPNGQKKHCYQCNSQKEIIAAGYCVVGFNPCYLTPDDYDYDPEYMEENCDFLKDKNNAQ